MGVRWLMMAQLVSARMGLVGWMYRCAVRVCDHASAPPVRVCRHRACGTSFEAAPHPARCSFQSHPISSQRSRQGLAPIMALRNCAVGRRLLLPAPRTARLYGPLLLPSATLLWHEHRNTPHTAFNGVPRRPVACRAEAADANATSQPSERQTDSSETAAPAARRDGGLLKRTVAMHVGYVGTAFSGKSCAGHRVPLNCTASTAYLQCTCACRLHASACVHDSLKGAVFGRGKAAGRLHASASVCMRACQAHGRGAWARNSMRLVRCCSERPERPVAAHRVTEGGFRAAGGDN